MCVCLGEIVYMEGKIWNRSQPREGHEEYVTSPGGPWDRRGLASVAPCVLGHLRVGVTNHSLCCSVGCKYFSLGVNSFLFKTIMQNWSCIYTNPFLKFCLKILLEKY